MAYTKNIVHPSRHTPYGGSSGLGDIIVLGLDWSGATFVMVLADEEGGTVRKTLNNAAAGSEGISATYDADYVHPQTGAVVGATTIRPQIDEATLEGLAYTGTDPKVMYHDLAITPVGENQRLWRKGAFTIQQGAAD
jgi:azurin